MRRALQYILDPKNRVDRSLRLMTQVLMTLSTVRMLLGATFNDLPSVAFYALFGLLIFFVDHHADKRITAWLKQEKKREQVDADRLSRLSLGEIYEDYVRRKQEAKRLYEAEIDMLDKDYHQYLNALEEQEVFHDR